MNKELLNCVIIRLQPFQNLPASEFKNVEIDGGDLFLYMQTSHFGKVNDIFILFRKDAAQISYEVGLICASTHFKNIRVFASVRKVLSDLFNYIM